MGVLTTLLLGGSSLYHIQSILIFASCLILFDHQKERWQILAGVPFVAACIIIGELHLFNTPDFSNHWWNEIARIANISSLMSVSAILITFIIRLNAKNENDLNQALNELQQNTRELKKGKIDLEEIVKQRTAKLSEQRNILQQQNEEKVILLKEIHHRVKNNLQVIISLINLQLSKFNNTEVQNALQEVQNRVHSMSLVHQKMYSTSNFKDIELVDYTQEIINNISKLYGDDEYTARIDIPQKVSLDIETAIPTGLIINEIVTNFFKHNHSNGIEKQFDLTLTKLENDYCLLKYKDNGKGFPDNFKIDDSNSLGLHLIETLAEQLDGNFNYYNQNGAVYEIQIPSSNIVKG